MLLLLLLLLLSLLLLLLLVVVVVVMVEAVGMVLVLVLVLQLFPIKPARLNTTLVGSRKTEGKKDQTFLEERPQRRLLRQPSPQKLFSVCEERRRRRWATTYLGRRLQQGHDHGGMEGARRALKNEHWTAGHGIGSRSGRKKAGVDCLHTPSSVLNTQARFDVMVANFSYPKQSVGKPSGRAQRKKTLVA